MLQRQLRSGSEHGKKSGKSASRRADASPPNARKQGNEPVPRYFLITLISPLRSSRACFTSAGSVTPPRRNSSAKSSCAEVMAMEDIVPGAPVLDDRLTVPFDPAAEARPLESEQSQAAVQKSQKKPCYDSWAELLGAIDRASHHRREDDGENEIEGRLFREKAFVRKSDNDERGEENQHGAERDLQDSQAGSFHTDTECRKKVVHHSNESPTPEGMSVPESFMSRRSGTKTRQPGLGNAPIMRQDRRPQREMRANPRLFAAESG